MKKLKQMSRRPLALLTAFVFVCALILPAAISKWASAAQVTGRSITISNAGAGATSVVYAVTMTMPTAVQSMVIDFCSDSPIIGATCTAPTGMNATSAGYSATNPGGNAPVGSGGPGSSPTGWSKGSSTASNIKLTTATPTTAATKYTFYITGMTNPTTVDTFYARVYTYTNATYGATAYVSPTSPGSYADYGGFALSINASINVSATVMESLTFCASKVAPATGCTSTTTPSVTLGHGSPKGLDSTATDTDTAYTQISTNAQSGAIVTMRNTGSTACAGLSRDGGATCQIAAQTTAGAIAAGNALFGAQVAAGTPLAGGTGSTTAVGSWGTAYYMSNATYSTYGDAIMNTGGTVCADVNTLITFAASASATTPAGIYTATESLIATGTF